MSINEDSYEQGSRMAWRLMLQKCCQELGYDDPEAGKVRWIVERQEALNALRSVCADYGDNNWESSLHLADIIDKHLHRNLLCNSK